MTLSSTDTTPRVVSTGHAFLECPRWYAGHLYASDFFAHGVYRWDASGTPELVCEVPEQPSGLGWTPDGDLLVVSMRDRRLLRWDGEVMHEVANLFDLAPWHCNDMVVDAQGRAYIGNFGWDEQSDPTIVTTMLHRVDPDGSIHEVATDLCCPNGMAITPDGATLLVAESFAARITAFDVAEDGSLSDRRVWAGFTDQAFTTLPEALASGVLLPDGVALAEDGSLWVADCAGGGASRVREGGEVLEFVSTGDQATFALALGGPQRRTLFLCCTIPYPFSEGDPSKVHVGSMRAHDVVVAGVPLPGHA